MCLMIFARCGNSHKTSLIDKDGNLHILTGESGRIIGTGPSKIIVHGTDTVVTIDDLGNQKIWISSGLTDIDTTKTPYYLKKQNGNNVNIYIPVEGEAEHTDGIG